MAALQSELTFLNLLVSKAPRREYEELLLRARRDGARPEALQALEQAKEVALHLDERLRELDRRKNGLSALIDSARDLGEQVCLDTLLTTLARRFRMMLHTDVTWISLYASDGRLIGLAGDGGITALSPDIPALAADAPAAMADCRTPLWTTDYLRDETFPRCDVIDAVVASEGLSSLLAAPLRSGDRLIGVLHGGDRAIRSFTREEIALTATLADCAAAAVERTRALEESLDQIRRLSDEVEELRGRIRAERHAEHVGRRLTDLVLGGADAQSFANAAAGALGGEVWLRDEIDLTVARTGDPWDIDEEELAKAALDARAEERIRHLPDGVTVAPVRLRGEDLGCLVLRRTPVPGAGPGAALLERATRAAGVLALLSRRADVPGHRRRDEALAELISTSVAGDRRRRQHARRLEMDPDREHVVVITRAAPGETGRMTVWASSYVSLHGGAKTLRDGCLVLLLPGGDAGAAARDVMRQLGRALGREVTAAGAMARGHDGVGPAYQEAARCLEALVALGRHGTAATVEELGFVGMLLGGNRDVGAFIEATIGPVIAYDAERSTDLSATLAAYFAAKGSPTYAAEALQVHPNTVARRLERIGQLLGPDWQQPAQALEIQLALRLQQLRASLGPASGAEPGTAPAPCPMA
ncbi:helix-turn-helix domain-containing protein [Streptomyces aidingensis]|uniref:GAF domain-containing protein n=1 Tax=Streptomyces aidingensis TaxID=910347 RepID=A0A1I1FGK1_9ACTN|nr:helix-turn-helix domain-containing protein [Streptomyces aidingensis]SFB98619.1 GAF domain-containing protein [Streptomyces aidingensis]